MQNINEFSKGLHRSNSPISQPEGSYYDALNWIRNDEGRLTNEELEEITVSNEGELLGHTVINGKVICFFKKELLSEIGVYDINEKTYTIYFSGDLGFKNTIDATSRVMYNNEIYIFFVEEGNSPRYFNLNKVPENLKDFNLFLDYNLPYTDNFSINENGNLPTGVYQFVIRHSTSNNNKSNFGLISNVIPIVDNLKSESRENYDGADPQSPSSKSISFNIKNVDTSFPFIEIIVITYLGTTSTLSAFSLGNYSSNTANFTYFSNEQNVSRIDISEITNSNVFYNSAKHIEQKDNILVLSNLETEENIDFQEVANNIKIYVKPEVIPFEENFSINFGVRSTVGDDLLNEVKNTGSNYFYTDYKNELTKKGFQRGEIYSLFFIPIYTNGYIGTAFPIPSILKEGSPELGLYTTSQFISTEKYPDNYTGISNQNVRLHQMPNLDEYPLIIGNSLIRLSLVADNINLTDDQKSKLQGYIIGYQKRDSSLNRRIVTEGILRPYLWNSTKGYSAPHNGSSKITLDDGSTMETVEKPYYSFISADVIHGEEIFGNKLEYSGYYNANSKLVAVDPNGDPIFSAEYLNAFSYTNKNISSNILDRQEIPLSGVNNNSVIRDDSVAIKVRGTKGFLHFKTSDNLIPSSDYLYDSTKHFYDIRIDNTGSPRSYTTKSEQESYLTENNFDDNNISKIYVGKIINNLPNQYGRVENAEVYPLVYSFDTSQNRIQLEGDTYIQKYGYYLNETFSTGTLDDFSEDYAESKTIIYTFLESRNNFNYRHYNLDELPYYPKYNVLYSEDEPIGLYNIFLEKGNSRSYNKQYSITNTIKSFSAKPSFFEEVTKFSNRSIYSETLFESELVNQWRVFPANNFHDIPKNKGEITDTFVWNNDFYHHTERSLFKSFFNPNITQATSQGEVVLGNSGVFKLLSKEVFTMNEGYMGTTSKCGVNTPFGRIFLDNHQGKVFLLSENPKEISDTGMFSFFRGFINPNKQYTAAYDYKNKRFLLSDRETAISYYPNSESWTSFHDFTPDYYLSIDRYVHAFSKNNFYSLENSENKRKNTNITLIANNNPDVFKLFQRCELNTMSTESSIRNNGVIFNDYIFKKNTFTSIQCWNDKQNSTELPLYLSESFSDYIDYNQDKIALQITKGAFNLELPLDAVINVDDNIFDVNNLDIQKQFKEFFTSKYLYIRLTYKNNLPLSFNYIKTYSNPIIV